VRGNNVILEHVEQGKPISLERRETCEALRRFLFGAVGNEGAKCMKEKDKIFHGGEGTAEQCCLLYRFWIQLDPVFTGFTLIYQLQSYLHHIHHHKLKKQGQKVVAFLLSREKNKCSVEDMMRIIWPGSSSMQLSCMKAWMGEEDKRLKRVLQDKRPSPQVLPDEDCEALSRIFDQLDSNHEGRVSFQALESACDELDRPLVDRDIVLRYASIFDPEGSGYFGLQEFLQMLSPDGFCASTESNMAVSVDGDRISRSSSGAWYTCESN